MASNALDTIRAGQDLPGRAAGRSAGWNLGRELRSLLAPLASLRLTVVLFALAIFLIFVGTLAQVEKDIWEVMGLYFRCWIAWVPLQIFFPKVFFPNMGPIGGQFPFPGGFLIGSLMALNLTAAHAVRFTIQGRGARLAAGLAVIGIGCVLTWLVVMGGSHKDLVESGGLANDGLLWLGAKLSLTGLWLVLVYGLWVLEPARRLERCLLAAVGIVLGGLVGALWIYGGEAAPDPSAMRILWQLVKATSASLVLLAGCVLVFRKRAGVVLLHAGIGLMMANELVVYSLHSEGMMQLAEGEKKNYAEDIRTFELAVVDRADARQDDVTVVPRDLLLAAAENGGEIRDEHLPFDIAVSRVLRNSTLRAANAQDDNPATAGAGLSAVAEKKDQVSGVESSKAVDMAAAYVKLLKKGTDVPLGTWLVGLALEPQPVEVDGRKYELALRFKRDYKAYTVALIDTRKDDYMGTSTPRNYSSDVRLIDSANGFDKEFHIWMNNPLRYAGETFYQSNYTPTPRGEISTLQVVKNTGWMLPYVACMIVATGMCAHFLLILVRFLRRRNAEQLDPEPAARAGRVARRQPQRSAAAPRSARSRLLTWALPAAVVVVFGGWLLGQARVPRPEPGEFDFYAFGQLPIVYEGRVKPIDTFARNTLQIISGEQTYKDERGQTQPAVRWLLDLVTDPQTAFRQRVLRIESPDVRRGLHLDEADEKLAQRIAEYRAQKARGDKTGDEPQKRRSSLYSIDEIQPSLKELEAEVRAAREKDVHALTIYQKKVLELDRKITLCAQLIAAFRPPPFPESHDQEAMLAFREQLQALFSRPTPLVVPPPTEDSKWLPYAFAEIKGQFVRGDGREPDAATLAWQNILADYDQHKPTAFNTEVGRYRTWLAGHAPSDANLGKTDYEAFFNHFAPFYWACVLCIVAFVLTVCAWLGWPQLLNRTAFCLLLLIFVVHTIGLVSRVYISGRPPVTNLYSSAVFIGWGCMLLGLALETIYRLGIGNLVASVAGFATLLIAHFLSGDGDTFTVLQAVLDTQFWLATHVVCVTLGYATTFVAGLLGMISIFAGAAHALLARRHDGSLPSLPANFGRTLYRMTYGVLCFAIFFSFVGTVLGGLWADDSWGRFWGWDPKENGALIIVLWNALVLHARWGGLVKERGLAVLAVVGNIVTAWSWFGVNELGAGLHSYGFTEGVARTLGICVLAHLGIIALGLLPQQRWLNANRAGLAEG